MYEAFRAFKALARSVPEAAPMAAQALPAIGTSDAASSSSCQLARAADDVKKLRLQLQQRDNEIGVMATMLRKQPAIVGAEPPEQLAQSAGSDPASNADRFQPAQGAAEDKLLCLNSLQDRTKAFEMFRRSYRKNAAIESNRAVRDAARPADAIMCQCSKDTASLGQTPSS
jgi:hypothetical protein